MDVQNQDVVACTECEGLILQTSRFCRHCGSLQTAHGVEETATRWELLKQTSIFYLLFLGICCLFNYIDAFQTFAGLIASDVIIALITGVFVYINWTSISKTLRWPGFSLQKLCLYCAVAFIAALLVHYSVTWLNITLNSTRYSYYYLFFSLNGRGISWLIFCTALTPALVEELAFRGYLITTLSNVIDTEQAAFISSFLFAIVHLSFLSLFWLIPFALLLSYVRITERTIWYGVAIHFCFNLTACLFEIL